MSEPEKLTIDVTLAEEIAPKKDFASAGDQLEADASIAAWQDELAVTTALREFASLAPANPQGEPFVHVRVDLPDEVSFRAAVMDAYTGKGSEMQISVAYNDTPLGQFQVTHDNMEAFATALSDATTEAQGFGVEQLGIITARYPVSDGAYFPEEARARELNDLPSDIVDRGVKALSDKLPTR